VSDEVAKAVEECARAAKAAAPSLATASDEAIDAALTAMANRLLDTRETVLEANRADVARAQQEGMSAGLLDRLTITEERLTGMAEQLRLLAGSPHAKREIPVKELSDGLRIIPRALHGGGWPAHHDHRMATTGALIGLRVPGVQVDDIGTTAKTLPEFTLLWERMLRGASA